jgi:lysophospholipase L1-like esterase
MRLPRGNFRARLRRSLPPGHPARLRLRVAAVAGGAALVLAVIGGHVLGTADAHAASDARAAANGANRAAPSAGGSDARSAHPAGLRPATVASRPRLRTSCRSVAHIGDSTSVGMVSDEYLPDRHQQLFAQYRRVGVRQVRVDASGGRSIVETLPGQVNGYNVARSWDDQGYRGCWVFALGTNDTANVSVGSPVGRMARITRMMSAAHGQPVLWVNTRTLLDSGPWSEANMRIWNDALHRACARYPNMRIFDWSAMAKPGWFISDGIHYTSAGYAARAHAIANALARAFPRSGQSRSCVVR